MENTERRVNIRGYARTVTVQFKDKKTGEWIVKDGARTESVPEHDFYHSNGGGPLVARGTPDFDRKYPNHPVEIDELPAII